MSSEMVLLSEALRAWRWLVVDRYPHADLFDLMVRHGEVVGAYMLGDPE